MKSWKNKNFFNFFKVTYNHTEGDKAYLKRWWIPFWGIFVIIVSPAMMATIAPLVLAHMVYFFWNPSYFSLLALFISVVIQLLLFFITQSTTNDKSQESLIKYLTELKQNKIKLYELEMSNIFSEEQLDYIEYLKIRFKKGKDIGRLFILIPPREIIISQFKGFNFAFMNIDFVQDGDKLNPYSSIFLASKKLDLISRFFVFHEIGHMTRDANLIRNQKHHASNNILIFTLVLIFVFSFSSYWCYLFFIPLYVLLYQDALLTDEEVNLKEEIYCDTVALELLSRGRVKVDVDRLYRLLTLFLPKERLENIQKARKTKNTNRSLNLFLRVESVKIWILQMLSLISLIPAMKKLTNISFISLGIITFIIVVSYVIIEAKKNKRYKLFISYFENMITDLCERNTVMNIVQDDK